MSRYRKAVLGAALACTAAGPAPAPLGVGRPALPAEIAAWNIDVRPDGQGLPPGHGTAAQGEALFQERCAACHGEFGEGAARWPVLAGGQGSLRSERPEKTIGSFWPNVSTVFDYVHRAMPYGNAQSLEPDETYAIVAYLLSLNDVIKDPGQELNERNLAMIHLPNETAFYDDDRETTERAFWNRAACMHDCRPSPTRPAPAPRSCRATLSPICVPIRITGLRLLSGSWNTIATGWPRNRSHPRADNPATSRLRTMIRPRSTRPTPAGNNPNTARASEDFPDPLSPTNPTASPSPTVNEASSTATTAPAALA